MDIQAQVVGQITQKPTNNGGQKFSVPLSDGSTYSTFEYATAAKAGSLNGQVGTFRVTEKPNPRGGAPYKNLEAVAGPGEQLPPEIPQAGTPIGAFPTQQAPQAFPAAQPQAQQQFPPTPSGGMSAEDKIRVTKLSCIGSACELLSGSGDVDAALDAAQRIFNAVMQPAQQAVAAQQVAAAVAADPQAVAQFAADQAGAPVVQVGVEGIAAPAPDAALPWATA